MSTIADRLMEDAAIVATASSLANVDNVTGRLMSEAADALERCEALLTEWIGVDSNTAGTSQALVLRAKTRAELARLKGGE